MPESSLPQIDLSVQIGSVKLRNPILVASGTFGYGREMAGAVDYSWLGGLIPKTITLHPRIGNAPPRSVETPCGMLNSIGLDNDGLEHFLAHHLPYLRTLPTAVIVNVAGKSAAEFAQLAERLSAEPGIAAIELNLSCPNVSGGLDFATDARITYEVVRQVCRVSRLPVWAKLTPNVTDIVPIARAAAEAGAEAISLVNTFVGMAVDWRKRRPVLGNVIGGLSGPAIKPLALRFVWQAARAVNIPVIGIGGISTLDDVMEFLIAGASAVQIGTANFFDPTVTMRIVDALPQALQTLGADSVRSIIGTLQVAT
jgi:dihydroorotate dehydrogenase (NAD+) catalytic subunit